jgi:hypothetical protein
LKKKTIHFNKWSKFLLIALVKSYETSPGEQSDPQFGLDPISMGIKAGILDEEVWKSKELEEFRQGNRLVSFKGVQLADVYEAINQMKNRGWILFKREERLSCWVPTPAGLDQAHSFMRPLYLKVAYSAVGDVRTIVVSAITALVVYFLLKIFS